MNFTERPSFSEFCQPMGQDELSNSEISQDTPLSCEPTLLPEPNHVMINHLYALSIKDGVMVLSATNR